MLLPGMVVHPCNPCTQEVETEHHKFMATLAYNDIAKWSSHEHK